MWGESIRLIEEIVVSEGKMTNTKPGKNELVSSVEIKGRRASSGEILDGSEFVRERHVLQLELSGLLFNWSSLTLEYGNFIYFF